LQKLAKEVTFKCSSGTHVIVILSEKIQKDRSNTMI
jgi:hypothetical protein